MISTCRSCKSLIAFPVTFVNEFLTLKAHYLAAAIAFYAFLSLFPLTIALITFFHLVLGQTAIDDVIVENLVEQIPVLAESSGPSFLESFITDAASKPAVTSSITSFVLFISALGVFGAIRESVNIVWRLTPRASFIKQRFIDAMLMIAASLLLLTSIAISAIYSFVGEIGYLLGEESSRYGHWFFDLLGLATPLVISFALFIWIYSWLPNTRVLKREIWPISLLSAVAFEFAKFAFIFYLRNGAERFLTVYGSVATLMMFFIFIYVEAIVLLAGAMLCAKWTRFLRAQSPSTS